MERASNGNDKDLTILEENILKVPHELKSDALKLFCVALGSLNAPPAKAKKKAKFGVNPVVPAKYLMCIHLLGCNNPDFSPYSPIFLTAWPLLLKWSKFMYSLTRRTDSEDSEYADVDKGIVVYSIAGILNLFFEIGDTMDGTPHLRPQDNGTFELMCKMWMKVLPNEDERGQTRLSVVAAMRCALEQSYNSKSWTLVEAKQVLWRVAENKPAVIARNIFSPFKDVPSKDRTLIFFPGSAPVTGEKWIIFVRHSLEAIIYLIHEVYLTDDLSEMMEAMIKAKVPEKVVTTFIDFQMLTLPLAQRQIIGGHCLKIVRSFLESRVGSTIAPRFLQAGLLTAIAGFIPRFAGKHFDVPESDPSVQDAKIIIGTLLPHYLFHYNVIANAIDGLEELLVIHPKMMMILRFDCYLSTEWTFFSNLVMERAAIKASYDVFLEKKDHRICHNVNIYFRQFKAVLMFILD